MLSASKEQLKVIRGLEVFNSEIATTNDRSEASRLSKAAIDLFSEQVKTVFSAEGYSFSFHTLSSFILRHDETTSSVSMWRFDELSFIGDGAGIQYFSSPKEDCRVLSLVIDAESVAKPPANLANFEPFFNSVNLPIESILEVRSLS